MQDEMNHDEVTPPETPEPRSQRRLRRRASVLALKAFVRALNEMHPHEQRADILWLADRYLGLKPKNWTR